MPGHQQVSEACAPVLLAISAAPRVGVRSFRGAGDFLSHARVALGARIVDSIFTLSLSGNMQPSTTAMVPQGHLQTVGGSARTHTRKKHVTCMHTCIHAMLILTRHVCMPLNDASCAHTPFARMGCNATKLHHLVWRATALPG